MKTDTELNALFVVKVAGWPNAYIEGDIPDFCNSADEVLPWLEKWGTFTVEHKLQQAAYWVQLWREFAGQGPESSCPEPPHLAVEYDAEAPTFAKSAVLALLRAHNVETE